MAKVRLIMFLAASGEQGWEERKFAHTNAFTNILCTHYDCTGEEPPEAGYRISEYKSENGESSTHYRTGDWVVTNTDVFVPDLPIPAIYDEIAVCSCVYDPIEPKWKAFGKGIVSFDSFGCEDLEAYYKFITSDEADKYEIRFDAGTPLTEKEVQELKNKAKLYLEPVAV